VSLNWPNCICNSPEAGFAVVSRWLWQSYAASAMWL